MQHEAFTRGRFLIAGAATLGAAACGGGGSGATVAPPPAAAPTPTASPTPSGPVATAAFSVNRSTTSTILNSTFAGLSYEKGYLHVPIFTGTNAASIAMFSLLGPSILRIGGNSVDTTTWTPGGPGGTKGQAAPADVDALAAFLKATGWQVIYGINLAQNTASLAASEATYVAKALGSSLYGFEIGNEPDLYHSNTAYPASIGTYAGFRSTWESFVAAIRADVPGAIFTGPAAAYNATAYTIPFASDESARNVLLTQHYYRANGQLATSTIELLLMPDPSLPTSLGPLVAAAKSNGLRGFRMGECGSFYNGGAPGVSDAYGTALWALDYLFVLATNGATGANFHGGGSGPGYTPISDSNGVVVEARPAFYGMLAFAQTANGKLGTTTIHTAPSSFTAYCVARSDGSLNIVAINKDPATTILASIALDRPTTSLTTLALSGSSLSATEGTTLGTASIGSDGSWHPTRATSAFAQTSALGIAVPPASALVLTVQ